MEKSVLDKLEKTSLIIGYGLPKTGKTTILKGLAELLEIPPKLIYDTDILRWEVINKNGPNPYSEENMKKVYDYIIQDKVFKSLARKETSIFDATFKRQDIRKKILNITLENKTKFIMLYITADEAIILNRIDNKHPNDSSQITRKSYFEHKAKFQEPSQQEQEYIIKINGNNLKDAIDEAHYKIMERLGINT